MTGAFAIEAGWKLKTTLASSTISDGLRDSLSLVLSLLSTDIGVYIDVGSFSVSGTVVVRKVGSGPLRAGWKVSSNGESAEELYTDLVGELEKASSGSSEGGVGVLGGRGTGRFEAAICV